jgi:hypothetical protein
LKRLVESPHAAKSTRKRDLDHRKIRLVNQLLGQQHTARLCDRDRRRPNVLAEQPPQLPLPNLEPIGERRDVSFVKRSCFN